MGMPESPLWDQDTFRFRDGVTNPSSEDAAFDGSDSAANTNITHDVDTLLRCRFVIQQTNAIIDTGQAVAFELRFERNAIGGFLEVGTQGAGAIAMRGIDGAPVDGAATSQVLGGGANFFAGEYKETSAGLVTGTVTADSGQVSETEIEFCFEIVGSEVSDGDTFDLRLFVDNNAALDSYTVTARVTANVPPPPAFPEELLKKSKQNVLLRM